MTWEYRAIRHIMVVAWDDDPVGNALDIGAIKAAIKASKGEA